MKKRITQSELGRLLGLDKSSVSLALRGSAKVSEVTRQRVVEAAKRYGYRMNVAAQQLSSNAPRVLAFVFPASLSTLSHLVAVYTLQAVIARVRESGLMLRIVSSEEVESEDSTFSQSGASLADGFFVWGDVPARTTDALVRDGAPLVVLDPNHPSYQDWPYAAVAIDNRGGAAAIVEHLLERGADSLLVVGASSGHLGHRDRWESARETWLAHRPLSTHAFCMLGELTDQRLREFTDSSARPAVFCTHDAAAAEVWRRLRDSDIRVPDDVLLVGFDGDVCADALELTTAVFDWQRLAYEACETLLAQLAGDGSDRTQTVLPVQLRPSRSTAVSE